MNTGVDERSNRILIGRSEKSYEQYSIGDEIFAEGSTGKDIYMVIEGRVEISQKIGGASETIAIMEEKDFFGEMSPITNSPRFATATAMENVSLQKLSLEEILWDMHNDRQIMRDMFFRIVKRLRHTTAQLNIEMVRNRPAEVDFRATKISYLRKKLEEKNSEVENLRKQLDPPKRYRPTRFYLSLRIFELAMLVSILLLLLLRS